MTAYTPAERVHLIRKSIAALRRSLKVWETGMGATASPVTRGFDQLLQLLDEAEAREIVAARGTPRLHAGGDGGSQ